jgi:group I intron endonuclease
MVVYLFTNLANGKKYVGKTTHRYPCHRWSAHYRAAERGLSGTFFHRALRKYGRSGFSVSIIGRFDTEEDLSLAEQLFIQEHRSVAPDGYNLTTGGEGTSGRTHSEATRARIRANHPRNWAGKKHSKETREKMSASSTRRKRTASGSFV